MSLINASRVGAELSVSPAGPYIEGETVNLTCIIQPSSGMFTNIEASFQFNNSATCYGSNAINTDMTGDIDSTRYTFTGILPGSSLTNATGILVIDPFMAIDTTFPFACCGTLGGGLVETFNTTFLHLADPPSSANISISTTYDSSTSCNGNITLTWLAVTSDRAVTNYEVLLNGTNITTLSPTAGTNTYTINNMSLATFNGTYTVRAVSCAGSSVSNEVVFTPLTPPSNATINISTTYDSDISCPITLSWPEVIADRNVTSYEVLLNGITNITTLSSKPGINNFTTSNISLVTNNGRYTVRAINCAGSSVSNEREITPPNVPSTPSITYITGNSSYIIFSIASTGIIATYYIHINGSTDMITPNTSGDMYNYTGSLIPMYGNYNFSISAGNCVGNSSISNSLFIIGDVEPTATTAATTTSPTSTNTSSPTTPSSTATSPGIDNSTNPMISITIPTSAPTSLTPPATTLNVIFIVVPSGGALLITILLAFVIIISIVCFYKRRKNRKNNTIITTFLREPESNIPSQHDSTIQMSKVSPPIHSTVDDDAKRSDQKITSETNKKNEPPLNYAFLDLKQKETKFINNPRESTKYSMLHHSNVNEPPK